MRAVGPRDESPSLGSPQKNIYVAAVELSCYTNNSLRRSLLIDKAVAELNN